MCAIKGHYVSQDYVNLIGYTYLSLEYSAFVYTAQKEYQIRLEVQNKYSKVPIIRPVLINVTFFRTVGILGRAVH